MVGLTVRSMVTVATRRPRRQPAMSEAYSSAPAYTEPATPEAATRNPDDEYTQPDGSRMCDAHCTVVKMVGVQEPSTAPPVSLLRAPVQVVLSGRVASSSGGQRAHQQRRSAARQDSHLVVQDYWKERMAQSDDDRMMHKANGGCPSEIIEPPSPCGSEGDPYKFEEIPRGFSRWVNRKEDDSKGWEGELPQLRRILWRPGLRLRPTRLALCDSDGDSGAEDDGGGSVSHSGTEDDGGGDTDDGACSYDDAVDMNPAFTWDDLHWNDPIRPTRRDLPQARVRFRILGVHRDGTVIHRDGSVKTNLWTQPPDGEEYTRVRLCLFVRGNGYVLASTKAHGWARMPDERGRVSATYVHLRLRTRRSTPESTQGLCPSPCWRMQGSTQTGRRSGLATPRRLMGRRSAKPPSVPSAKPPTTILWATTTTLTTATKPLSFVVGCVCLVCV